MGQKPVELLADFHALRGEVAVLREEVARLTAIMNGINAPRDGVRELFAEVMANPTVLVEAARSPS